MVKVIDGSGLIIVICHWEQARFENNEDSLRPSSRTSDIVMYKSH